MTTQRHMMTAQRHMMTTQRHMMTTQRHMMTTTPAALMVNVILTKQLRPAIFTHAVKEK